MPLCGSVRGEQTLISGLKTVRAADVPQVTNFKQFAKLQATRCNPQVTLTRDQVQESNGESGNTLFYIHIW